MKLSVIIPLYNKEDYIELCLKSIVMSSVKPFEVILVDDKSTDSSLFRAQKCLRLFCDNQITWKIITHEQNKGPGAARNSGIDAASGDYVLFLDADDCHVVGIFEELFLIVKKHPDSIVFFQVQYKSNGVVRPLLSKIQNNICKVENLLYSIDNVFELLGKESLVIASGNVLCKKSYIGEARFNEKERIFEDWEFWFRILECQDITFYPLRLLFFNKPLLIHNDEVEGSLQRKIITSPDDIFPPLLLINLMGKSDDKYISYRKRLCSIWLYNSIKRLGWRGRSKFILTYRSLIVKNFLFNRYYLGVFLGFFGGGVLPSLGKAYKKLFYKA